MVSNEIMLTSLREQREKRAAVSKIFIQVVSVRYLSNSPSACQLLPSVALLACL
jgi:hypothetical protein